MKGMKNWMSIIMILWWGEKLLVLLIGLHTMLCWQYLHCCYCSSIILANRSNLQLVADFFPNQKEKRKKERKIGKRKQQQQKPKYIDPPPPPTSLEWECGAFYSCMALKSCTLYIQLCDETYRNLQYIILRQIL